MRRLRMRSKNLELNQALAFDKLEEFVRQEEARGAELVRGSDFERALALLTVQRQTRSRIYSSRVVVRNTVPAGSRSSPSSKASPRRVDAPRRVLPNLRFAALHVTLTSPRHHPCEAPCRSSSAPPARR